MENASVHRFGPEEISACLRLTQAALAEDFGSAGDITSVALVPDHVRGAARLVARASGVVAGLEAARIVFTRVDATAKWDWLCRDGATVEPGQGLARIVGSLRSLLAAERTSLNFLTRLSGIATATRRYVDAVAGTRSAIFDTRKTTPGWRVLEKYAVRAGGGRNHRMGLYDGILIKDNHRVAWSASPGHSLADAVHAARAASTGKAIEIEVDSIAQLREVLPAGPQIVLLDNMSLDDLRRAVTIRNEQAPQVLLEASGGVTLESVRAVAETGVDRISIGAITHSAPALDVALDFEEPS